MVTLRNRTTLKRPLKLRDSVDEGTTTSEMPAPKRQKGAATTTQDTEASTSSTKPKSSKTGEAAGERAKKRNTKAKTLADNTKSQGEKDDLAPAPSTAPAPVNATSSRGKEKAKAQPGASSKGKGRKRKLEDDAAPKKENDVPAQPAAPLKGRGWKKKLEDTTEPEKENDDLAPAPTTAPAPAPVNATSSRGKEKAKAQPGASSKGKGRKRKLEDDAAPKKENDVPAQPEAPLKGRGRKKKQEDTAAPEKENDAPAQPEVPLKDKATEPEKGNDAPAQPEASSKGRGRKKKLEDDTAPQKENDVSAQPEAPLKGRGRKKKLKDTTAPEEENDVPAQLEVPLKDKATEPEKENDAPAQPEASSKGRGRKRKLEDTTGPEKENDLPAQPAEAGKKPGRPRKRQTVQDIREAEDQSSRQKDDPLPAAKKPGRPKKQGPVKAIPPAREQRSKQEDDAEPQLREHESARARSVTVEPSKDLDGKPGTGIRRTKIILRMPVVIPEDVSELPMAEPEIPEFEESVETDWPQAVPNHPPVANRFDSRGAQSTGRPRRGLRAEAGAEAGGDLAVAGNPPKRRSTRAKAKARQPAEEEEVPELSALAKARLASIRDFKVAGFRGEAPGKPDGKLKRRRTKKNKPVSAAEEVRQTERWARSFLQEQNGAESAAAAEARLEILREKAKSCPRSKLAARRFKAKLRDWALRNGIQPALADAAVDEEVERARDEQYAFLELTKNTRRDLEQLGGE